MNEISQYKDWAQYIGYFVCNFALKIMWLLGKIFVNKHMNGKLILLLSLNKRVFIVSFYHKLVLHVKYVLGGRVKIVQG